MKVCGLWKDMAISRTISPNSDIRYIAILPSECKDESESLKKDIIEDFSVRDTIIGFRFKKKIAYIFLESGIDL